MYDVVVLVVEVLLEAEADDAVDELRLPDAEIDVIVLCVLAVDCVGTENLLESELKVELLLKDELRKPDVDVVTYLFEVEDETTSL